MQEKCHVHVGQVFFLLLRDACTRFSRTREYVARIIRELQSLVTLCVDILSSLPSRANYGGLVCLHLRGASSRSIKGKKKILKKLVHLLTLLL